MSSTCTLSTACAFVGPTRTHSLQPLNAWHSLPMHSRFQPPAPPHSLFQPQVFFISSRSQLQMASRLFKRSRSTRGSSSRQEPVEDVLANLMAPTGVHSFNIFGSEFDSATRAKYNRAFELRSRQRFAVARTLDWDLMATFEKADIFRAYLRREFSYPPHLEPFICTAWNTALNLREPIYRELCFEFFSTVMFEPEMAFNRDSLHFRLGGQMRHMSLVDFSLALGLYTQAQLDHPLFHHYIGDADETPDDDFCSTDTWTALGRGRFSTKNTKAIDLRNLEHRVLHRMIASTINGRTEGNKVNRQDLWLLSQLINPERFTNIPFVLANYLSDCCGPKSTSHIFGGQYVTRLARHFGLLTERVIQSLNRADDMLYIDRSQLAGMGVLIQRHRRGAWTWATQVDTASLDEEEEDDDEEEDEEEVPQQQPRRSHYRGKGSSSGHRGDYSDLCFRFGNLESGVGHLTDSVNRLAEEHRDHTRRLEYAHLGLQYDSAYQRNVMDGWFAQQQPPYQPPPYQPLPQWPPSQPQPPPDDRVAQSDWFGYFFPGQQPPPQ